jgi:hypothetical protein
MKSGHPQQIRRTPGMTHASSSLNHAIKFLTDCCNCIGRRYIIVSSESRMRVLTHRIQCGQSAVFGRLTALSINILPHLRITFGERAFFHAGPAAGNSLPSDIRTAATLWRISSDS